MSIEQPPEIPKQPTLTADSADIADNKIFAALAYIGILFLVPLLAAKTSAYARFHTNQGFIIFLGWVAIGIVSWVPILGWLIFILGSIFLLVLSIMGVLNALTGKMKKLPLIGDIEIYG